jgi:hypothetical protein
VIDALPRQKALARYANDARGISRVKGLKNNSDYIVDDMKAYIESKKAIPAGGEVFVDYGKDYWKVIRENTKEWAKEAHEKQNKNGKARNGKKRNGKSKK